MRNKFLYLIFFLALKVNAQGVDPGPRLTAMGNSGVALRDVWSAQSNQAGLAGLSGPVLATGYRSNLLSSDISTRSIVFAYPLKSDVFSVALQEYGFSSYSEQKAGLSWCRVFGALSMALNVNLHQVQIDSYGSSRAFSLEAGFQYMLSKKLILGSHLSNPGQMNFDRSAGAEIPTAIEMGASFQLSDKLLLSGSLVNRFNYSSDFHTGLDYKPLSCLSFRAGLNLNPFRQFAGFGYKYMHLEVDAAASYHPELGYSPQVSLGYEF